MAKKVISLSLALLMIFGTFSVLTVNAADVKILGTLTIKAGETKPLKFTDPNGNVVSVIWESSNPTLQPLTQRAMSRAKRLAPALFQPGGTESSTALKSMFKKQRKLLS